MASVNTFTEWAQWLEKSGGKIVHSELSVASIDFLYAGTLDAIVEMTDKHTHSSQLYVVDWKTTKKVRPDHALQLAAYAHAFEELYETKINGAAIVSLLSRNEAEWYHVKDVPRAFDYFCSALHLYRLPSDHLF